MALTVPGHWAWDFWLAHDDTGDGSWHIFFLKAPKSLGDPDLRHANARIGHARSNDLGSWEILPDPFAPGKAGAWDDSALWTGSCVHDGATWWMFYTAVSTSDDTKVQRVGAATSPDLMTWTKHPGNPVCEADHQWYEAYDPNTWYEEAWRDPWVFPDAGGNGWHMFTTARTADGPPDRRGAIGHARSTDLRNWEVFPHLEVPPLFGHLEVSQLVEIEGRFYLLFCVPADMQVDSDEREALTGTAYLVSDDPFGPFVEGPTRYVSADVAGSTYAGRVVFDDGTPFFLTTVAHAPDGTYIGAISDPAPLIVHPDGSLTVPSPSLTVPSSSPAGSSFSPVDNGGDVPAE